MHAKELDLEKLDEIFPAFKAEYQRNGAISFRVASAQADRVGKQINPGLMYGGGILVMAVVFSYGFETWEDCRKSMKIKKITEEILLPVMEANQDFLPLPAPEQGGGESQQENGEQG